MAKKNFYVSSAIIGLIAGSLIGWYIISFISKFVYLNTNLNVINIVSMIIFGIIGFILGLFRPVTTEMVAFGISAWIFLQIAWDFPAGDINKWRIIMAIVALVLFIFNLFTGKMRIGTAKKVFRRAIGIK